ncbi:hypothetical protein [Cereibacter sediminicola]|uniref:hypothetical protein n=1 Tax=Cereibacter sediminicola TaxID=2584941 RepID=UPI001FE5F49C|nr:hypothetical protein [Cereibacter sediminicola]
MRVFLFITLSLAASLALLFGATEIERRAIVGRYTGVNGAAILITFVVSFVGSLVVVALATIWGGWIYLFHLLPMTVLYHFFMGVFLVHGLQKTSERVALEDQAARQRMAVA